MVKHKQEYLMALEKGAQCCTKCGIKKPLSSFYFDPKYQKHIRRCKECRIAYNRENSIHIQKQAKIWKQRPQVKQRLLEIGRESYWRNRVTHMLNSARRNRRNLEFRLSKGDIIIPEECPIFKVPFDRDRFSPSLDRIDNTKGYIPGNIRVISKLANTMKNSATLEELKIFCINVLDLLKDDIVQTT
jgi:hypothetical protein